MEAESWDDIFAVGEASYEKVHSIFWNSIMKVIRLHDPNMTAAVDSCVLGGELT